VDSFRGRICLVGFKSTAMRLLLMFGFSVAFATAIHLSAPVGTLSIALSKQISSRHKQRRDNSTFFPPVNLARIPGQILFGHLSDKVSARKLIITMALASSVSVYAIWGSVAAVHRKTPSDPTGSGTAGLLVFSMVFGAFAGR
jgi:MFS family permease